MRLHQVRYIVAAIAALATVFISVGAWADAYDPPATYYDSATGTGSTLKSQLTSIMSAGHIQRTYGNFRDSAAITDADPNNPGNILLVYNRASVPATWDGGTTWNREHTWPDSHQPQDANNNSTGAIADPHMLRPCNPSINSSRGNKPYGLDNTTGNHGAVSGGYYYPGDADAGDMARTMFYAATRWSSSGFTLVDTVPTGFQFGDLSSLLNWHYRDVPDTFERRRNHAVYSQALNPSYYTNNRNAYVDHPEYVWSVFVDQENDSQISINGGTIDSDGGSVRSYDFGTVFVGESTLVSQQVRLIKDGMDGTYFEVATTGSALSSLSGGHNAFYNNQTDSRLFHVALTTDATTPGLVEGSVIVNNLDVTTDGGTGRGANDANDVINMSLTVLDRATPSFAGDSELATLMYDFGSVVEGDTVPAFSFDVFNFGTLPAFTADLDFDSFQTTGDAGAFTTDLSAAAGTLVLAGGEIHGFSANLDTSTPGEYSATYTLSFSDEDLAGALTKSLTLTLVGEVLAESLGGDFNSDGFVDAADYTIWRDGLGIIYTQEDYEIWKSHFGESAGQGAGSLAAVPEPSVMSLTLAVAIGCCSLRRR